MHLGVIACAACYYPSMVWLLLGCVPMHPDALACAVCYYPSMALFDLNNIHLDAPLHY